VAATDLVLDGHAENAFCAIRPPGHHATRDAAMATLL
jgi:acetoin utilization deacetylase AcuC-like enzyme